jgi:tetratricopeptide (TPR) repeat protein
MIVASIASIVMALTIWTIRPSPFGEWLGFAGDLNLTPLSIVRDWVDGQLAPMTPIGFLSLFTPVDLGILVALVAALSILLVVLAAQWRIQRTGTWWARPIPPLRIPRIGIRLRTALALIAILGLDLGWEIVAWRNWRVSEHYRGLAGGYASNESICRESLKRVESELVRLDSDTSVWREDSRTPAARAAARAYLQDQLRRNSSYFTALAAAYGQLRRKYERAAADPSQPLSPDPPLPEQRPRELTYSLARGEYARALSGNDELIRLYPDLDWAHERRAWVLATCPDARLRNGKQAVAAATRAAELTNWKDGQVLDTLAAAYAEAGDFASAVRWQERALERFAAQGIQFNPKRDQDRLALYKAGKPYRMLR